MIKVGVIGCGVIGKRRIENFPKNFKLIACADPKIFNDSLLDDSLCSNDMISPSTDTKLVLLLPPLLANVFQPISSSF